MAEVLYYAIPFFVLLLVVEALSFRHYRDHHLVGYELRDTRTSLTMGVGNVAVNVVWKLADDLAYYWFHRVRYGLTRNIDTFNPVRGPGWRPD